MTPPVPPPRRSFRLLLALLVLAGLSLFVLKEHLRGRTALAELRQESSRLRDDLDARDEALRSLQRELLRFRQDVVAEQQRPVRDPRIEELKASLVNLAALQSNMVAGMENMAVSVEEVQARVARVPETSPGRSREQTALGIEVLRGQLAERAAERAVIQSELVAQAEELEIPQEVLSMDPDRAVTIPAYRKYWPYFELLDEFDELNKLDSALRLRIEQEMIESKLRFDGR